MTEGAAPLLERLPGERMLAALGVRGLTRLEREVLAVLAYHDAGAGAWPSQGSIAARLDAHPKSVQRALAALTRLGLVAAESRAGKPTKFIVRLPHNPEPGGSPEPPGSPPPGAPGLPPPGAPGLPPPEPPGSPHYVEPELNRKEEPEYQSRCAEPRISDGRGKAATRAAARGQTDRSPARPDSRTDDIAAAVQAWNDLAGRCGLPRVQRLTETRRRSLRSRLRETGGIDGWNAALAAIEASPFLTGDNDRGWRADFDFVLKPQRFTKIMEGGYPAGRRGESSNARNARIALERLNARRRENPDGDPNGR